MLNNKDSNNNKKKMRKKDNRIKQHFRVLLFTMRTEGYSVCVSVYLSVTVILPPQATQWPKSDTNGLSAK